MQDNTVALFEVSFISHPINNVDEFPAKLLMLDLQKIYSFTFLALDKNITIATVIYGIIGYVYSVK